MPSEDHYSYTLGCQKEIFAMMMYDRNAFITNMDIVKPEHFENPVLRNMMVLILKFFKKYTRMISETEFLTEMDSFLNKNERLPRDEYCNVAESIFNIGQEKAEKEENFDWPRDKAIDFAQYQGVKKALLESGKQMGKKDYGGIVTQIRNAMTIGESEEDLGIFLYADLEKRLEDRQVKYDRSRTSIPTFIRSLDGYMRGGICPPEVGVMMAPLKQGKTTMVANFTKGALLKGYNVIHYLFESNMRATLELYDAMISGIVKEELKDRHTEVRQAWRDFFAGAGVGELIIKHLPAHYCSAFTIESHLNRLEISRGFKPHLLIVDYLGLMRTSDKQMKYEGSSGGRYVMFGQIALELISLAQRGNYAMWIVHQTSKGSKFVKKIGTEYSADSQEPVRHADLVLTLGQTKVESEMKPPILHIFAAAARNIASGWDVELEHHEEVSQMRESKMEAK